MSRLKKLDLSKSVLVDDVSRRHTPRVRDLDVLFARVLDVMPSCGLYGSVFDDMHALRGDFDEIAMDLRNVIAHGEKHKRENAG